jgi:hypothetical protein
MSVWAVEVTWTASAEIPVFSLMRARVDSWIVAPARLAKEVPATPKVWKVDWLTASLDTEHIAYLVRSLGVESLNLQATSEVANLVGGKLGRVMSSRRANASDSDRKVGGHEELGTEHTGGSYNANEGLTDDRNGAGGSL